MTQERQLRRGGRASVDCTTGRRTTGTTGTTGTKGTKDSDTSGIVATPYQGDRPHLVDNVSIDIGSIPNISEMGRVVTKEDDEIGRIVAEETENLNIDLINFFSWRYSAVKLIKPMQQSTCGSCWAIALATSLGDRYAVTLDRMGYRILKPLVPSAVGLLSCSQVLTMQLGGSGQVEATECPSNEFLICPSDTCSTGGNVQLGAMWLAGQYAQGQPHALDTNLCYNYSDFFPPEDVPSRIKNRVPPPCNDFELKATYDKQIDRQDGCCARCCGTDGGEFNVSFSIKTGSVRAIGTKSVRNGILNIKQDLIVNGPVPTQMTVPSDFREWYMHRNRTDVYDPLKRPPPCGSSNGSYGKYCYRAQTSKAHPDGKCMSIKNAPPGSGDQCQSGQPSTFTGSETGDTYSTWGKLYLEKNIGGHAVVIVGWGYDENVGALSNTGTVDFYKYGYWEVRNSWGDGSGVFGKDFSPAAKFADEGFFRIRPSNPNYPAFHTGIDIPRIVNGNPIGGAVFFLPRLQRPISPFDVEGAGKLYDQRKTKTGNEHLLSENTREIAAFIRNGYIRKKANIGENKERYYPLKSAAETLLDAINTAVPNPSNEIFEKYEREASQLSTEIKRNTFTALQVFVLTNDLTREFLNEVKNNQSSSSPIQFSRKLLYEVNRLYTNVVNIWNGKKGQGGSDDKPVVLQDKKKGVSTGTSTGTKSVKAGKPSHVGLYILLVVILLAVIGVGYIALSN